MFSTMNGFVDKGLAMLKEAMLKEAMVESHSELRWEINFRGNDLLRSSKFDDALKVMQFNVQEFPDWPLAYTSLAGFYEDRGDRDKALENCRKALELHPDDRDANAMLQRLGEQ